MTFIDKFRSREQRFDKLSKKVDKEQNKIEEEKQIYEKRQELAKIYTERNEMIKPINIPNAPPSFMSKVGKALNKMGDARAENVRKAEERDKGKKKNNKKKKEDEKPRSIINTDSMFFHMIFG